MKRSFATAILLASTALTGAAFAQPAQQPAAEPTAQRAPNMLSPTFQTAPTDIGRVQVGGTRLTPAQEQTGITGQAPGGGLITEEEAPKSRSTVTQDFIGRIQPTANPYQMLNLLPGVNQASADAYGLNGGTFTIRGLRADQMGFTVEGVPVNDSGNYAVYPQEYIDGENLQQIVLSHGSADLDSPHIGATGGVVNMYLRDPSRTPGALVNTSVGMYDMHRVFGRIDSGEILSSLATTRMFVSYSNYQARHWGGPGTDSRDHFDFKSVTEFGQGNRISFALMYNDAVNNFYKNPSRSDFYTRNWYFNRVPTSSTDTNYYGLRVNPFRNLIMSAPSTFTLTDNLTYDVIPYFWYGYGNGGGATAFSENSVYFGNARGGIDADGNGTVNTARFLAYTPSITRTYRPGIVNKLTYVWDNHRFNIGYHFERAEHHQYGPASLLNADFSPQDVFGELNRLRMTTGPNAGAIWQKRDTTTYTTTHTLFAGDTIGFFNDRLFLDLGVKQAFIERELRQNLPGTMQNRTLTDSATLPTGAVRIRPNDNNLLFASVASNFRSPPNFTLFDSYSNTTGALTQRGVNNNKTETSLVQEIGWRYQDQRFLSSITLFHYDFWNRQVTTNVLDPAGGGSFISSAFNAGRTRAQGVDLEFGTRPIYNFRPYASFEYLNTEILSNYATSGTLNGRTVADFLRTQGKSVPQSPRYTAGLGIAYDDGLFFGNLLVKHISRQAATFTNDQWLKEYQRLDIGAGVYLPSIGAVQTPMLRLNMINVANTRGLTGVSSVQTNAAAARGVNGSTISAGGTPLYYLGNGFTALITLTAPVSFN